jgi:predicted nucleic acid-binding protein
MKWFVPEVLTEEAIQLLQPENALIAPDLLVPETCNTLWKKVNRKELEVDNAAQCIFDLARMPIALYPSMHLAEQALRIAAREGVTVYDSLYLALALVLDCDMVTATVVATITAARPSTSSGRPLAGMEWSR